MPPSKILRSLGDGTTWPVPGEALGDLEWDMRYADDEHALERRLVAASVINAYHSLLLLPQRERNKKVAQIRSAARAVFAEDNFERVVGPATPPETPGDPQEKGSTT